MKYKIVADSSADLTCLSDVDFESSPLKIMTDEREFIDDERLDTAEMLDYLKKYKGKSRSSCPNIGDYLKAFGDAENVFCVTITSNLSGSCNAAENAAREYMARNDGRRVHVIDSLTTGPENALLVEKLRELILSGLEFDEIKAQITEYHKHTRLLFALESMLNLSRNGRVSPIVARVAGVLGIRVVGRASEVGTLEIVDKPRGAHNMLESLVSNMEKEGFTSGRVRIHHAENLPSAERLRARILERFPDAHIVIDNARGLCSFYAECGGLLVGFEV